MCKPLRNKGQIDDLTRAYLELKFYKKDGTEYKGNIGWDGDYNAFTNKDESLEGKYFDEDGSEVKHTIFSVGSVKSAVKGLIKYHEDEIERLIMIVKDINDKETQDNLLFDIEREYEDIIVIEHWLEDAIDV